MTTIRPITIVGGGLAGLSLGIALRKAGVPTKIFEAGDYPRHRVCGEFITGLAEATIDRLAIGDAFTGIGWHRSVTWFLKGKASSRNLLPSPVRAISRYKLDTRLAEIFTVAGGELSTHTRCLSSICEPGLVHANGRKRRGVSPWLGLKLHVRNFATTDDLEFHLGDGAYVGLSSVEDDWINVCGLFRRRPRLQVDRDDALSVYLRASGLSVLADRLAQAQIRAGSKCAVAGFEFDGRTTEEDGVRLGDACAMIPPFTGNGMAMAFISAERALKPLLAWARDGHSWEDTASCIREILSKEFRLRLATAQFLHPFLLKRRWQRCFGAIAHTRLLPITTLYRLLH